MAETLSGLRLRFRDFFKDASNTLIDRALNDALNWLSVKYPLLVEETTQNVTADQNDFALDAETAIVFMVEYQASATDKVPLTLMTWQDFEDNYIGWRDVDSSRPNVAFIRSGTLLVYPTPDTSTGATYPRVLIVATKRVPNLSVVGDEIPDNMPQHDAVLFRALREHSLSRRPSQTGFFTGKLTEAINELGSWIHGRIAGQGARLEWETGRKPVV